MNHDVSISSFQVPEKYPLPIRILHWLIALMIISLLVVGLVMAGMSRDDPYRSTLFALHKSFGITVLMLAAVRLMLKAALPMPPLPGVIPAYERMLAHLGHWALYGFMFAMPVSGYLMSASSGLPVKWFGLAIPRLVSIDRDRGGLANLFHTYAAYALIGLITLHVAAVLLHYVKHRVNLLKRMT